MRFAVLALLFALGAPLLNAQPAMTPNAPVKNFRLPVLNLEGVRTSLLRGEEARYIDASRIDLVEMQYIIFDEKDPKRMEATLLAPTASVLMEDKKVTVHGNGAVRLIRDDVDATGEQWTFERDPEKRILIQKNVHVVFRVELKDLLK